jgi:hypothetical protein
VPDGFERTARAAPHALTGSVHAGVGIGVGEGRDLPARVHQLAHRPSAFAEGAQSCGSCGAGTLLVMLLPRVVLSFWFLLLIVTVVVHQVVPDAHVLGAAAVALLTCLLMAGVSVALWRWDQRGAALGAAGLTLLQGAVLLQGFARALNWW